MMSIMILVLVIILTSTITMKMSILMSKKLKLSMEKMSPFECGFNPINNSRIPFSLRFFLITILFLIFDVEITLFLPMIFTMKMSNMKMWLITSFVFLIILLIGLSHEWNQGILNWQ